MFSDLPENTDLLIYFFKFVSMALVALLFNLLRCQRRAGVPLELETMLLHRHPALVYCSLIYLLWSLMGILPILIYKQSDSLFLSLEAILSILNSAALILLALQFVSFDQPFWRLQRYAQRYNKHVELLFFFSVVLGVIFLMSFVVAVILFSDHKQIEPLDVADWVLTTLALFMLAVGLFKTLFENFKSIALFSVLLIVLQWLGNGYLIFVENMLNIRLMLMIPALLEAPLLLLAIYSSVERNLLD